MNDDEILEKAQEIQNKRNRENLVRLHRERYEYAKVLRDNPITVVGTADWYSSSRGTVIGAIKQILEKLPEDARVEVIIKCIENGHGSTFPFFTGE